MCDNVILSHCNINKLTGLDTPGEHNCEYKLTYQPVKEFEFEIKNILLNDWSSCYITLIYQCWFCVSNHTTFKSFFSHNLQIIAVCNVLSLTFNVTYNYKYYADSFYYI